MKNGFSPKTTSQWRHLIENKPRNTVATGVLLKLRHEIALKSSITLFDMTHKVNKNKLRSPKVTRKWLQETKRNKQNFGGMNSELLQQRVSLALTWSAIVQQNRTVTFKF